jgi:hypothetical protein
MHPKKVFNKLFQIQVTGIKEGKRKVNIEKKIEGGQGGYQIKS